MSLPKAYRCIDSPPDIDPEIAAPLAWEINSTYGSKWDWNHSIVARICNNPTCINPLHCFPLYDPDLLIEASPRAIKAVRAMLFNKQVDYTTRRKQAEETMATLSDIDKERIAGMGDREAEAHVLQLRADRRAMSTTNKVAKKVGNKAVSKRRNIHGQSLDVQLEGLTKEELEAVLLKLNAKGV